MKDGDRKTYLKGVISIQDLIAQVHITFLLGVVINVFVRSGRRLRCKLSRNFLCQKQ